MKKIKENNMKKQINKQVNVDNKNKKYNKN